jgi:outer membrane lipoprotein SlyB
MQTVVFATVVSVDRVILSGDGDTGAVAGAIIGGVAGASVTDSETESDIAGVLGALGRFSCRFKNWRCSD